MPEDQIEELERNACEPKPVVATGFNPLVSLPHGLTVEAIEQAMEVFTDFLGFLNVQLNGRGIERLESMLMPANFSSMVGEFMISNLPKFCPSLVKNRYHNGHPDLIPAGKSLNDSAQHQTEGIEIKASRYSSGWQGHNAEECWLMVFVFDSSRPVDVGQDVLPKKFEFLAVYGAQLALEDWKFSGRNEGSRRTPTAAVTKSGYRKMTDNWIYRASLSTPGKEDTVSFPQTEDAQPQEKE